MTFFLGALSLFLIYNGQKKVDFYTEALGVSFSYIVLLQVSIYALSFRYFNQNKLSAPSVKNLLVYLVSLSLAMLLFMFLLSINLIGYNVKEKCIRAQEKYPGDCVEALTSYLDDDGNEFRARNSAVWALGELGDQRALPALENYYTGEVEDRFNLNQGISQYELKKAINLTSSGFNATAFFWRFGTGIN